MAKMLKEQIILLIVGIVLFLTSVGAMIYLFSLLNAFDFIAGVFVAITIIGICIGILLIVTALKGKIILSYMGYDGTCERKGGKYVGHLLNTDSTIQYMADSREELEDEFRWAVKHMIEDGE